LAFLQLVAFSERGRKELMKVMRERRFLVALALVSAIVMGSAGTSSAFLADDGFSHTQPAAELIMPFDVTTGKSTFLLVSNIGGTSSGSGGAQITTHWTFWSETCDELADFSICLTFNDTVVVDPTNARSQGPDNGDLGPLINLSGKRGLVTVTAYRTDATCADFTHNGRVLTDDALVGTFTFADNTLGYAFGNDAFGLGLDPAGTAVELPDASVVGAFDIQTFDPTAVNASVVVLSHLRQQSTGPVTPNSSSIRFATTFLDTLEIPTSLPDQTAGCVKFTQVESTADTPGLIPTTVSITTSGLFRLSPIAGFGPGDYLYGIIGQAVGQFGASTSAKVTLHAPSASRAFVDAPASLLE
jgi:hypothetical protein